MKRATHKANDQSTQRPLDTAAHLASVAVKNFKSIKDVTVDLGQVNVFVGANGVGKSCLLEAIGILGACAAGDADDEAFLRRGVRPGVPDLYKSSFRGEKMAHEVIFAAVSSATAGYRVGLTSGKPVDSHWLFSHESIDVGGRVIASRRLERFMIAPGRQAAPPADRSVTPLVRLSEETEPCIRDLLAALDEFRIFAPNTPVLRGIAPDAAPRGPIGLHGGRLAEACLEVSQHKGGKVAFEQALTLIDWAGDVDTGEPRRSFFSASVPATRLVVELHDRYMAKRRNVLSGYDASEGALYILFMLVLAIHPQSPAIFAVDNFDQALNPRTARALTRMFVENILLHGRQVLLTTHNPLVLDGLDLGDDRVRLFAVSRDASGHSVVRRVPVRDFAALKEKYGEHAVSRLWIEGRLGGMPDNV